ncbi:MAG: type II secretion system F family protein [Oscillospiraceae bacterium]
MKMYTYSAKDSSGSLQKGSIQCEDYNDFLEKIHDKGLFCMGYKEAEVKEVKTMKKFTTKDLAFDCRQLSAMMSAGLTLVKALDILFREQEKEAAKQVWREIYEDVQKGQSFSDSLKARKGIFPDFLISMVSAGESSGSLDTVMNRMSDHYASENKMHNKIKGALTYPIILLCLSVLMVFAVFTFIMPMFMDLFDPETMPKLTKVIMGAVEWTKNYWYIVLGVVLLIVMAFVYLMKTPSFRIKWDKFMIKGPAFGKLVVKVYTGRFARTLSSLYSSGIPMVECIERSSAVLGNSYISKLFETVVDEVKQGETLSASIQRTGIFDSMFCSIIYVGEESGALDDILVKSSSYYEDEADSAIQKLVTYIEPLMIILLGVMVGLICASILPAMYTMFGDIK